MENSVQLTLRKVGGLDKNFESLSLPKTRCKSWKTYVSMGCTAEVLIVFVGIFKIIFFEGIYILKNLP